MKHKHFDNRVLAYNNHVARPKKVKNPHTSVAVVMNIDAEDAGSLPNRLSTSGMRVPKKVAMVRFTIMDTPITNPKTGE